MTLRVLHINTQDRIGGAGRAAFRLHSRLNELGVKSRMLVGLVSESNSSVAQLRAPRQNAWDVILSATGAQYLFYLSSFQLPRHPWVEDSDIINLHNTHGGYFSHTVLPTLSRARPVVWTLHDIWALTGHCSYSYECEKWKTGCGGCPYLHEYPRLLFDTTAWLWRIKRRVYAQSNLTIVTPSHWLADMARASPLLGRFQTHVIPNGVDTRVFHPIPKSEARARLTLPNDRPIVFWTGDEGQEFRKGRSLRERVTECFKGENRDAAFLILQGDKNESYRDGSLEIIQRARIHSDAEMADYYSAADVFVLPSRADNLPNTAIESLACGTPVVAFVVGGVPEIVSHMQTGYLAQAMEANELANGIRALLDNDLLRNELAEKARRTAISQFDLSLQTQRYLDLYHSLLSEHAR